MGVINTRLWKESIISPNGVHNAEKIDAVLRRNSMEIILDQLGIKTPGNGHRYEAPPNTNFVIHGEIMDPDGNMIPYKDRTDLIIVGYDDYMCYPLDPGNSPLIFRKFDRMSGVPSVSTIVIKSQD